MQFIWLLRISVILFFEDDKPLQVTRFVFPLSQFEGVPVPLALGMLGRHQIVMQTRVSKGLFNDLSHSN